MNYLLKSEYINTWKDLSNKELRLLQDTLVDKINSVSGSPTVIASITTVLEILEEYMSEREIL